MTSSSSSSPIQKDPAIGSYHKVLIDLLSKNYSIDLNDPLIVRKAIHALETPELNPILAGISKKIQAGDMR